MSSSTRNHWLAHGIPAAIVERMAAFEALWGGLLLPPAPLYEGGPKIFRSDIPEMISTGDWWFDAGDQRFSMGYGFCIGPRGQFGIEDGIQEQGSKPVDERWEAYPPDESSPGNRVGPRW